MPIDPQLIRWDDAAKPAAAPAGIRWDDQPAKPAAAPLPPLTADPTGSFGENVLAGLGQFMTKLATGGKNMLDEGAAGLQSAFQGTAVGNALDSADRFLGNQSPQDTYREGMEAEAERRRRDAPLDASAGGKVGSIGGAVGLGMLAAPASIPAAFAMGAGLGAAEPTAKEGERLQNMALGGAGGAAGAALVKGAARVIRPNTAPEVTKLMDKGVTPTPGHVLGGGFARAEDALTSVPLLGDAIRSGQARAVGEMNEAAINMALKPIGAKLPKGLIGREAIEFADDALGNAYNRLLPKMTARVDQQFAQDLSTLRGMVQTGTLAEPTVKQFERIVQNGVLSKLKGPQGVMTGQTLKAVESDLGRLAKSYGADPSAETRLLGDAVRELQAVVRGMVSRSNPHLADELAQINAGWANFVRVRKAASSVAAEGGVFTPAQLQAAVKSSDGSKTAFAKGNALMQDLSDPARMVLGTKMPDSGTPARLMMAGLGGAGIGGAAWFAPQTAIAAAMPALAYTPIGQRAIAALFASRPASAQAVAEGVRSMLPAAAAVGGSSGAKLGQ